MLRRSASAIAWTALALGLAAAPLPAASVAGSGQSRAAAPPQAPAQPRLADKEFWRLIEEFSEPNGFFRSDNLVSNEDTFQYAIPSLRERVKEGGVYLGVGPDQNFTYIAALKPRMVFITDIRRGNLHVHLMYKALFELSTDRVDFLSRLFSRPRPAGVGATSSAEQLFDAYAMLSGSQTLYDANLRALFEQLRKRHGFPISQEDESGIAYVYSAFFAMGPFLSYSNVGLQGRGTRYPTYQDLQMADDGRGGQWAYLASEQNFRALKTLQQANLIVPIVGNFAGTKALRSVGAYVRQQGAAVTTFYTSNVEQYLFQDQLWDEFARNLETLPLDATSTLIRSCFNQCRMPPNARSVTLLDPILTLLREFRDGRIVSYFDVLSRSR
jgi:hypothetical protein